MTVQKWGLVVIALISLVAPARAIAQVEPMFVEPADLEGRADLIGRELLVDDHLAYYVPRTGLEPDELQLKRTKLTFLVPRQLRPGALSRIKSVIVRGRLVSAEGRLHFEVADLRPVAGDLERLEQGTASLPKTDFDKRRAWARWAQRRARDFQDDALLRQAKQLEADALRIETQLARVAVDAPAEWLAKAQEARRQHIAEPLPSALAHRALRAKLAATTTSAQLKALIREIEAFFPRASSDRGASRVNLARWEASYAGDPAKTYQEVSDSVRKALDRRLWADATERLLDQQATEDVQSAVALAEEARTLLPEKPDFAAQLLKKAVDRGRQSLENMRLADAKALSRIYQDKLNQPDQALGVLRDWLNIQRERLSKTDAEGPLWLAGLYEELLQDRVTAVELLRTAWKIDPGSKEIAEAFRSRGFRKVKDDWIEGNAPGEGSSERGPVGRSQTDASSSRGLLRLTADEVRIQLGQPQSVNYVASKGQLIEQWIFAVDTKQVLYVNLLRTPGELKPRVVADYTLPRTSVKGEMGPAR